MQFLKITFGLLFLATLFSCNTEKNPPVVIVLGLDGMRPDGIENAYTPNLHRFIAEGTSTMNGRAVYPTSSGANWSSMLLGSGPDQHGIDNNGWKLENRKIIPVHQKSNGYSPSIFDVLKQKYPDLRFSAVFNWMPIANYFDTEIPDTVIEVKTTTEAIDNILSELIDEKADFVFSQIDHMDNAGHGLGYGSDAYLHEAEILDKEIGRLIETLEAKGMYDDIYIITLSDHGGTGFGHGGKSMLEYEVPFIIRGPGIQKGKITEEPILPFDVAATVAIIFDCKIPFYMTGSNVSSAFGEHPELLSDFIPKPIITIDTLTDKNATVRCTILNGIFEVKYATNQKNQAWKNYTQPVKLLHGDTIYAATIVDGKPARTSSYFAPFVKHKGNSAIAYLKVQPSEKYDAKGGQSLVDGLISGTASFANEEWLGFQGEDLNAKIDLGKTQMLDKIIFRFLESTGSWIFLPKSVEVYTSDDGNSFTEIACDNESFKIEKEGASIREFELPLKEVKARYLKIVATNFGELPVWHVSAGNPAWLFTDEIIIE